MRKNVILFSVVFVFILSVFYIYKRKQAYNFYQSERYKNSRDLIIDLTRHYYTRNYQIPNEIAGVFEVSTDFFVFTGFPSGKPSGDINDAFIYIEENIDKFRIIDYSNNDSVAIYQQFSLFKYELKESAELLPDSVMFITFLLKPFKPILFATFSYYDIRICGFPFSDYRSYNEGIEFRTIEFDSIIREFHKNFHDDLRADYSDLDYANLLFTLWYDNFQNKWKGELLCNYNDMDLHNIDMIKNDLINEISFRNFENYTDSLLFPVFIR